MKDFPGKTVMIGQILVGGGHPTTIQSMTNTPTTDVRATVGQAIQLFDAGADMVRISVPDRASADALSIIKRELNSANYRNPLIADVHYKPQLANLSARYVEKVRINPGNFIGKSSSGQALASLVSVCREYGTALRIGTNMGSLSAETIRRHGYSAAAMVESTLDFLCRLENLGFNRMVISLKASNPRTMIEAHLLMADRLKNLAKPYPFHIGLTEAGSGLSGRIRSAMAIGLLLGRGIGDTVRVSLSEDPVKEIPVARKILKYVKERSVRPPAEITKNVLMEYNSDCEEDIAIMAAIDMGESLLSGITTDFNLKAPRLRNEARLENIRQLILQAAGLKNSLTELISCPACARACIDVEQLSARVKRRVGSMAGIKIAIMGCVVNGPGEMAGAHYGLLGSGKGRVSVYKDGIPIRKSIPQGEAVEALLEIIGNDNHLRTYNIL